MFAATPTDAFLPTATAHRRKSHIGAGTRSQNAVAWLPCAVVGVHHKKSFEKCKNFCKCPSIFAIVIRKLRKFKVRL